MLTQDKYAILRQAAAICHEEGLPSMAGIIAEAAVRVEYGSDFVSSPRGFTALDGFHRGLPVQIKGKERDDRAGDYFQVTHSKWQPHYLLQGVIVRINEPELLPMVRFDALPWKGHEQGLRVKISDVRQAAR